MGDSTVMGVENPRVVRRIGGPDLGVMVRYTEVLPSGWCAQHVALGVLGEHHGTGLSFRPSGHRPARGRLSGKPSVFIPAELIGWIFARSDLKELSVGSDARLHETMAAREAVDRVARDRDSR